MRRLTSIQVCAFGRRGGGVDDHGTNLRHPGNNRTDRGEGFPSGHPVQKVVLFSSGVDTSNIWARSPAIAAPELRFKTNQINDI